MHGVVLCSCTVPYGTVTGTDFHGTAYFMYGMNFTKIPRGLRGFLTVYDIVNESTRLNRVLVTPGLRDIFVWYGGYGHSIQEFREEAIPRGG